MPETLKPLAYDEPTVLWRMRRADAEFAHAVIGSHTDGAILVWYFNERPLGYRIFSDLTDALRWSDQLQVQNWAVGWRAISE